MGTTVHPDAERLRIYDAHVRKMVADPDMRGDVLAVGLAMAWLYRERGPVVMTMPELAETAKIDKARHPGLPGSGSKNPDLFMLKMAISDDAPCYQSPRFYQGRCEGPMVRRDSLCGKPTNNFSFTSVNWDDGTRNVHYFCSRHRVVGEELRRQLGERDLRRRAEQGDPPRPVANAGGLLQRHFPGIDWTPLYSWAAPGWRPPEQIPTSYSSSVPSLQLIAGDGDGQEQIVGGPPSLRVLHGMPDGLSGNRRPKPRTPRPVA